MIKQFGPLASGSFFATVSTAAIGQASVWVMMAIVAVEGGGRAEAVTVSLKELYRTEHWPLVRLASLLLHDRGDAEEVVHDAFVNAFARWDGLHEPDKALAYLRSAVLNGARSRLRHVQVARRHDASPAPSGESPEASAIHSESRRQVLAALRSLPRRQFECLALRYYGDLSEAEIAAALGISPGSVKTHAHRGMAALAARLEDQR